MTAHCLLIMQKISYQPQPTRGHLHATQIGLSGESSYAPLQRKQAILPLWSLAATCSCCRKIVSRNRPMRGQGISSCGNLQTKLARRWADVSDLWLGCPGRGSGSGQPDSPPQSPELTCVRWARGDSHRWRVTSHRWRVVIRLLTLVPGPRLRLGKSMQTLWRSCGVCRTAAPPGRDVVFMVEKQRKTLSGG